MQTKRFLFCLSILTVLNFTVAWGGGPLLVNPDGSGPFRWDPAAPVHYKVDRGGLNTALEEQGAVDFVASVFKKWHDLTSVNISFQYDGLLDIDVTQSNVKDFEKNVPDGLTPIILDRDGGIIDLLLGAGASRNVLGFAGPRKIDPKTNLILQGEAVINGAAGSSQSVLAAVMLHEFGHLIGLDHTQAGLEFTGLQRGNFVPGGRRFIPIMFPIIFNGAPQDPQDDDILALSNLYPRDFSGTGTISGFVKRASGDFFPGADVVLRNADYNPGGGQVRIYSMVSDYLMRNTGEFRFQGVKPGDYYLFIEPLFADFTEGSSVGPYDSRFTSFPTDFYNGDKESGDPDVDDPNEKVVITVGAGGKVENLVMISNEIPNNLTTMADDDSVAYVFPNGFKFAFFGQTYDRVFVNSDGNLTFGKSEIASTERDLKRFTSGPPRIGVLFTDLNPEQGGEVLFTQRDNSVTFTWLNVPEFSKNKTLNATDGNQFSVTLFSNGDIRMKYGNLKVTRGDQEALVAVVGVSPGGGAAAQQVELSQNPTLTYGNTTGIAKVYTDSIDLAGKELFFQSGSGTLPRQKTLIYPFSQQTREFFTGIAISNSGSSTANVKLTAYDGSANSFASVQRTIPGTSQLAALVNELLGTAGPEVPSGWIQLQADSDTISSFYQIGSFDGRWLDGSTTFSEISTHLYLTRVFEGSGAFQGKDAQTLVSIVNPNDIVVRLVLSLYSPAGLQLSKVQTKLPPRGSLFDRVSNIFKDTSFPRSGGYISVQAIGGGVAAFELVRAGDSIGLSAITPALSGKFYSAQLAHGAGGGQSFFTSLNIANTTTVVVTVNGQAFNENHQPIGTSFTKKLDPLNSVQSTAAELFGLADARTTQALAGSIELSADSAGVVADVLFGDASPDVRFAADLPMQTDLATEAIFSHVANGAGYFTGIALYNPNSVPANVTLEVYTAQGRVNRSTIVLQPGRRISQLVNEFIPSVGAQIGGYIVIKSDVGILAQELFGNLRLDFLSAVPADVVKKADLK